MTKIKFQCEACCYITHNKYDWNKHLLTKKHKKNLELSKKSVKEHSFNPSDISSVPKQIFECPCGKNYKYYSGLSRHKMKCSFIKNINLNVKKGKEENTNNSLVQQQRDQIASLQSLLEKTIESQQETLNNLMDKVGNTTNNNTINNMQINFFLNEECKNAMNLTDFINSLHLSLEDLKYTRDNGYIKGITNIFVKNLQDLSPTDRPIHCSDKKKLQFYVKDDDQWEQDGSNKKVDKTIESITQKQIQKIKEWESEHPCWNETDSGTESYMEMVKEVMGGISHNEKIKNFQNIKKEIGVTIDLNNLITDK
tara:strand:- start:1245 stop:2174 length:930 start_codon:yes stop_codon:yes gene_type:complete